MAASPASWAKLRTIRAPAGLRFDLAQCRLRGASKDCETDRWVRRALALRRGNSSCASALQTPGHVTLNLASPLRHSAGHSPSRPWRAQWQRSFLACSSASGWNTPVWRYNLDERSATIWGSSAHLVQRRDSRGLRIGACHEIPMPRRPIFDRPMTAAERQRRCRARKRQAPAPQARACQ